MYEISLAFIGGGSEVVKNATRKNYTLIYPT
jgi:hypothetical protein